MRRFLSPLPLLLFASCAVTLPVGRTRVLASGGVGCERSEYGTQARAVAIYTRVVAERVCVLDAAGQCHPRIDGSTVGAEIRLPQTRNAPPVDLLRQELGRRGILARIARPRGPKMYASLSEYRNDGLLVLELSEIGVSSAGDVAHVMVRASGAIEPRAPGGELVRLVRSLDGSDEGLPARTTSTARACWRLERSTASALAD